HPDDQSEGTNDSDRSRITPMPAVPAQQLVDAILDAIQESSSVGVLTSAGVHGNPRRFSIAVPDVEVLDVWIYIWTLTPGGRPVTMPDEYRIQPTGVTPPLAMN